MEYVKTIFLIIAMIFLKERKYHHTTQPGVFMGLIHMALLKYQLKGYLISMFPLVEFVETILLLIMEGKILRICVSTFMKGLTQVLTGFPTYKA